MITVEITLHSAINGDRHSLANVLIDNIGGTRTTGNYRVSAYRKGDLYEQLNKGAKPIRESVVNDHKRLAEPVSSLVRKALQALDY